jgi:hypothetical protein
MIRRKSFVLCILFFTSIISVFASNNYRVDWADGKVYSSAVFTLGRDYNYPAQHLLLQEEAKNQAEINFYRVFKSIEVSDNGQNLYEYIDAMGERKALLFSLSLFPIGAYVTLSDGRIAQVSDVNPENPKNPIVQILNEKDENGEPKTVATSDNGLRIVRVLNKQQAAEALKSL